MLQRVLETVPKISLKKFLNCFGTIELLPFKLYEGRWTSASLGRGTTYSSIVLRPTSYVLRPSSYVTSSPYVPYVSCRTGSTS
jgi:hypothetical protein